jgi:IS605 OrfB family transposase
VIYTQEEDLSTLDPNRVAAIDPGLNNLIALTSNKVGFVPRLVNGRPIKSVNQGYNRVASKIQKNFSTNHHTSRELSRAAAKRTRRVEAFLHMASRRIIDLLVTEDIGILVIGKNTGWKNEANMGKRNNQKFVQIPHVRLIDMLCYKAKLVGIQVILQEESYTSKASFLDLDPLPVHGKVKEEPRFSGKRIKRGMYKSQAGRKINADVNGSYNIMRKALPNVFQDNGIGDVNTDLAPLVVHPVRIVVPLRTQKSRKR